eukprot:6622322-Lingulodinium_polyedra.AAC.1
MVGQGAELRGAIRRGGAEGGRSPPGVGEPRFLGEGYQCCDFFRSLPEGLGERVRQGYLAGDLRREGPGE